MSTNEATKDGGKAVVTIRLAESDDELARCFPVVVELRPKLLVESFVPRVRSQQRTGYRMVYLEDGGEVVAVAGFRILETLVDERHLHVDDLVTRSSARSKGHGAALLRWLCERAQGEGCHSVQLDSGHRRKDAHRFYRREGMQSTGLHFKASPIDPT